MENLKEQILKELLPTGFTKQTLIHEAVDKTIERVIPLIKKHFKEEDKVLKKIDSKISHLMISRGIGFGEERKELLKIRSDLLKNLSGKE